MKASNVIVRFISLLDVTLILLGVLMITLLHAQLRSESQQGSSASDQVAALFDIDFIYIYAGWRDSENGKCFLLDKGWRIGREIRTDKPDDIQSILSARKAQKEGSNQVVMLLFSDNGWYSLWNQEKILQIEQAWKVKIVPVYNVRIR